MGQAVTRAVTVSDSSNCFPSLSSCAPPPIPRNTYPSAKKGPQGTGTAVPLLGAHLGHPGTLAASATSPTSFSCCKAGSLHFSHLLMQADQRQLRAPTLSDSPSPLRPSPAFQGGPEDINLPMRRLHSRMRWAEPATSLAWGQCLGRADRQSPLKDPALTRWLRDRVPGLERLPAYFIVKMSETPGLKLLAPA